MDIQVLRFAQQMQIELENNSHKTLGIHNWRGIRDKISDFEYHKAKMLLAIRTGDKLSIKEYIADCANILMSIGNEIGLYEEACQKTGIVSQVKEEIFEHVSLEQSKKSEDITDKLVGDGI